MTEPTGAIVDVLRRLADDAHFAEQVRANPAAALAGYDLSPADLLEVNRTVSALTDGSPLLLCDDSPQILCSASPLFQCNESPQILCSASPLFQCNESPLIECNGMITDDSPLLLCDGLLTAEPTRSFPGRRFAIVGAAVVAVALIGSLALGVCNGDDSPKLAASDATSTSINPLASDTTAPAGAVASGSPTTRVKATTATPLAGGVTATTVLNAPGATTTVALQPDPSLSALSANPGEIWETGDKGNCASMNTSKVTVNVTDPAGIKSVTLHWSVNGSAGSTTMSRVGSSDAYEAKIGAFKAGTVGDKAGTIALTATALDEGGRSDNAKTAVTLHSASEC